MHKSREEYVLEHVTKEQKGIEVGAWFSPLASRRAGYDCLVLDVFDGPTLRQRAKDDPHVPPDKIPFIDDVDLVGTSSEIADLVAARGALGSFDYIVSSHNFEHLPNPIKFLQGCGQVLKPDGLLSMAIPDRRMCFDHFRGNTRLSEWVQAFLEDRRQPTLAQEFDYFATFSEGARDAGWRLSRDFRAEYAAWMNRRDNAARPYVDTHCWTFTPTTFEILVLEAHHLGLSPFVPARIHPTLGIEFFAHLRNAGYRTSDPDRVDETFVRRRQALYQALSLEPNIEPRPKKKKKFWKIWKKAA